MRYTGSNGSGKHGGVVKSIIYNIDSVKRVQWHDMENPHIISIRHVNGVWCIYPPAKNDNNQDCRFMPKQKEDDRRLLIECMDEYRDLRANVTRWASIMQSMGYMDLAGQMDALSDYGDVVHTDILMRMGAIPAKGVRLYENISLSDWFAKDPESYT